MQVYHDFEIRLEAIDADVDQHGFTVAVSSDLTGDANARTGFARPLNAMLAALSPGGVIDDIHSLQTSPRAEADSADIVMIGRELYAALFAGAVGDRFHAARGAARAAGSKLRVRLTLPPSGAAGDGLLACVPWELAWEPDNPSHPLTLAPDCTLVRRLAVSQPVFGAPPIDGPLKVLALVSNPSDTDPLNLDAEIDRLKAIWSPLGDQAVQLRFIKAHVPDLLEALADGVHILHYMGHGGFSASTGGYLRFLAEDGTTAKLSAAEFATAIAVKPPRFVFLNACRTAESLPTVGFSSVASRLVAEGAPAVLAMQFPVSDLAALTFSQTVYRQIAAGRPVDTAVDIARRSLMLGDQARAEWATPVLYLRGADGNLFARAAADVPAHAILAGSPYVGLQAFSEREADRFYGREAQTERLMRAFLDMAESLFDADLPRVLAVTGPSGSGKSSLARAGLLPKLRVQTLIGGGQPKIIDMKPGDRPLDALALELARLLPDARDIVSRKQAVHADLTARGVDALLDIASALAAPLVLLIDQFEELFTAGASEPDRNAFIDLVLGAASRRTGVVHAVVTLRSDCLGLTQAHEALNQVIAARGVIVPAMTQSELRSAIAEPARLAGRTLDPTVVQALVNDTLGREGALPLMQVVLQEIWNGLQAGRTEAEVYDRIGGVGGALQQTATRLYAGLAPDLQAVARRMFMGLVRLDRDGTPLRARVALADLSPNGDSAELERIRAIAEAFSQPNARLLTLAADGSGRETVEVTHEALFQNWTDLRAWIEEARGDIRLRQRLADAAAQWSLDGRQEESGLLWRPPDLDLLRASAAAPRVPMSDLETAFHAASEAAFQRDAARRDLEARVAMEQQRDRLRRAARQSLNALEEGASDEALEPLFEIPADLLRPDCQALDAATRALICVALARWADLGIAAEVSGRAPDTANRLITRDDQAFVTTDGVDLCLRSLRDGAVVHRLSGPAGVRLTVRGEDIGVMDIVGVDLSVDAGALLLWRRFGGVEVWRAPWEAPAWVRREPGSVLLAAFSPDGSRVAVASRDNGLEVLNALDGAPLLTLGARKNPPHRFAWSPDGGRIAGFGGQGEVSIWDAASGAPRLETKPEGLAIPKMLAWSPDGDRLAVGALFGGPWVWDAADGRTRLLARSAESRLIAFSPDGAHLAVAGGGGDLNLWALTDEQPWPRPLVGHRAEVTCLRFDPDGDVLLSGSADDSVRVWSLSDRQEVRSFAHAAPVEAFDVAADRTTVVISDRAAKTRLWRLPSYPRVDGTRLAPTCGAFSPDGARLATVDPDDLHAVVVWDVASLKPTLRLTGHKSELLSVEFSPDGESLLTLSKGSTARLWSAADGVERRQLRGHVGGLLGGGFSFDGGCIITWAVRDDGVRIWDARGQSKIASVAQGLATEVAAISPGGDRLALAGRNRVVRGWDVQTDAQVWELPTLRADVSALAFSPDGQRLAIASKDGGLRLWDVAQAAEIGRFRGHAAQIWTIAFSPEGRRLVSAAVDGVRLWDVETQVPVQAYVSPGRSAMSAAFSRDGSVLAVETGGGVQLRPVVGYDALWTRFIAMRSGADGIQTFPPAPARAPVARRGRETPSYPVSTAGRADTDQTWP